MGLSGNTAVIGAPQDDDAGNNAGSAYTFAATGGGSGNLQTTTIAYSYDPLYRLAGAVYTGGITATYSYVYDAVGNRTAYTATITTTQVTTYTYNAANQLTTAKASNSPDTWYYEYDGNGNQVRQVPNGLTPANGETRYTFDQRNRLIQVEHHDGNGYQLQAEAVYDGNNARLQTIAYVFGVPMTTTYTLDGRDGNRPLLVSNSSGTIYLLYGRTPLGEYQNEWRYYLRDGRGSIRQLTNGSGAVTLVRTYNEFGLLLNQAGDDTTIFGFAGAQTGVGGLLYLDGRYYDPATGQILSPSNNIDPMRPGTLNGYLASLLLANPGAALFGPLLVLNWRRRKGRKGKYDRLLLLVVGIGLGITLVSCGESGGGQSTPPFVNVPPTLPPAPPAMIRPPRTTAPPPSSFPQPPPPTNTPIPKTPTLTPCPTPLTPAPPTTLPSGANAYQETIEKLAWVAEQDYGAAGTVPPRNTLTTYMEMIIDESTKYSLNVDELAYIFATIHWESHWGYWMEELADGSDYEPPGPIARQLGNTQPGDGPKYKGRRFVQLTGRRNYQFYTDYLGVDLINNPTLAADSQIATKIIVHGMVTGTYTGRKLSDFDNGNGFDFYNARTIINSISSYPGEIAATAQSYAAILRERCPIPGALPTGIQCR